MLFLRTPRARILLPSVLLLAGLVAAGLVLHRIASALTLDRTSAGHAVRTPVVVELFTSEGCSSCPSADALLARLQEEQPVPAAEILALEEHVDYWDTLGWHDRFSSHDITERQSAYVRRFRLDSNYTPQMVVDGTSQFTGVYRNEAIQAITRAAHSSKLPLSIEALMLKSSRVSGQVGLPASIPIGSELVATLVQPMATTHVLRGENGGRNLSHVSVVRGVVQIPLNAAETRKAFVLNMPKDLTPAEARVVVFVQSKDYGPILAAASSILPSEPTTSAPMR